MTPIDKSVQRFLGEFSDALLMLTAGKTRRPPFLLIFIPSLLSSILILSSTSTGLATIVAGLASSAMIIVILYWLDTSHRYVAALLKTFLFMVLFSFIVSAPLLVYRSRAFEGFMIRITSISAELVAVFGVTGWRPLLEGIACLGIPKELVEATELMTRFIPVVSKDAVRMLEARRARSLGDTGLIGSWRVLATALTALLEKSYERARVLALAIRARSLGGHRVTLQTRCMGMGDDAVSVLAYVPIIASIASYVVSLVA